jgi:hypothetical protein
MSSAIGPAVRSVVPTAEVVIQRAEDGASGTSDADAASPTPSANAGGSTASVPGSASLTEVDALVRRLYDPIVRRIKAELRQDRERAGHVLDLRH